MAEKGQFKHRHELEASAETRKKEAEQKKREREAILATINDKPLSARSKRAALRSSGSRASNSSPVKSSRSTPRSGRGRGKVLSRRSDPPLPMQSLNALVEFPASDGSVEEVDPSPRKLRRRYQNSNPPISVLTPTKDMLIERPKASNSITPLEEAPEPEQQVPAAQARRVSPRIRAKQTKRTDFSSSSKLHLQPAGAFEIPPRQEDSPQASNDRTEEPSTPQTPTETKPSSPPPRSLSPPATAVGRLVKPVASDVPEELLARVRNIAKTQPAEETILDGGQAEEYELGSSLRPKSIPQSRPIPPIRPQPLKDRHEAQMRKLDAKKRNATVHVVDSPRVRAGNAALNRQAQSKRIRSAGPDQGKGSIGERATTGVRGENGASGIHDFGAENDTVKTVPAVARSGNDVVINLIDEETNGKQAPAPAHSGIDVQATVSRAPVAPPNAIPIADNEPEPSLRSSPRRSKQLHKNMNDQNSRVAAPALRSAPVAHMEIEPPPLVRSPVSTSSSALVVSKRRRVTETVSDESFALPSATSRPSEPSHATRSVPPGQGGRKLANSVALVLSESEDPEPEVAVRPGDEVESNLAEIVEAFGDLNVQEFGIVVLHYTGITSDTLCKLCPKFEELPQLRRLVLSNNRIENIPRELFRTCARTTVVNFAMNSISSIPNWFFRDCSNLVQIDLSGNCLRHLPPEIANMSELELLDLGMNNIEVLPEGLGNLTNLRVLDLKGNKLKKLPDDFGKDNRSIVSIDISGNTEFCGGLPEHCTTLYGTIQDFFLTGTVVYESLKRSERKLAAADLVKVLIERSVEDIGEDSLGPEEI